MEVPTTVRVTPAPQMMTFAEQVIPVSATVDPTNIKTILRLTGWPELSIDTAQAVIMAESGGYADAVGDITLVSPIWGTSVGLFQIRSLKAPQREYQSFDIWRHAWPLREPFYNAKAGLALSKNGTDFTPWSTFNSGSYKPFLGGDPFVKTGHSQAASWWK